MTPAGVMDATLAGIAPLSATPGAPDFVGWQEGVTTASARYAPTAGKGLYRFRTRLRHQAAKAGSDWSPVASITVR